MFQGVQLFGELGPCPEFPLLSSPGDHQRFRAAVDGEERANLEVEAERQATTQLIRLVNLPVEVEKGFVSEWVDSVHATN